MNRAALFTLVPIGIGLALGAGCRRDAPASDRKQAARASSAASSGAKDIRPSNVPRAVPRDPITLLEWKESAYGTNLFVEGSTVLVLTPTAAIRVTEGTPPQKMAVPFGAGQALMGDSIIYWRDGAALAVSKHGSEPRSLGRIERPPQRFLASDNRLAWLDQHEDGTFSLQTFAGKTPRVLYRTQDHIAAAAMLEDRMFFVERQADGSWRIGRVSTGEAGSAFSYVHRGRAPSMLVPAPDGIYFYDGPTRSVRRSSLDLKEETVFAENVICSPLAVSDRVVCGHVEGVFEIPGKGKAPRVLSPETVGPIAAIAADETRAVWVVDTAENQLAVRSLPLPPP